MPKPILPLAQSNKSYLIPTAEIVDVTSQRTYNKCEGFIDKLKIETLYHGECIKLERLSVNGYRVDISHIVVELKHNAEVILITCKELLECDE